MRVAYPGAASTWPRRDLTNQGLVRCRLPDLYWMASFRQVPESAPYRERLQRYVQGFADVAPLGAGLYLWGTEAGTGKTAIACAMLMRAMQWRYSALFLRSAELKEAAVRDLPFSEDQSLLERARAVDVLALDDLGKEYKGASGYAENVTEDLLRTRVQAGRITLLTSNLPPKDMTTVYSKAMTDLLREACPPVEIVGPDRGGRSWCREREQALKALLR